MLIDTKKEHAAGSPVRGLERSHTLGKCFRSRNRSFIDSKGASPVGPQELAQSSGITTVCLTTFAFFGLDEDDLVAAIVLEHADEPIVEATDFDDRDELLLALGTAVSNVYVGFS